MLHYLPHLVVSSLWIMRNCKQGNNPKPTANPWLLRMWRDIAYAGTFDRQIRRYMQQYGMKQLYLSEAFKHFSIRVIPAYTSPFDVHVADEPTEYLLCRCGHICRGSQGLAMHSILAHRQQHPAFKFVICNECPVCGLVCSTTRQTRLLMARRFPRTCLSRATTCKNPRHFEINRPHTLRCSTCNQLFESFNNLRRHLVQHIEQIRWVPFSSAIMNSWIDDISTGHRKGGKSKGKIRDSTSSASSSPPEHKCFRSSSPAHSDRLQLMLDTINAFVVTVWLIVVL